MSFAHLSPDERRAVSSRGGKAAAAGNGHRFTTEEAKAAGRKGGLRHSREHMAMLAIMSAAKRRKRLWGW